MTELQIENARVIDPANVFDDNRTLFINNSRIVDACSDDADVIDASGLIACPGFIDLYARLREPGFTTKGTIETESRAALKGGFTTVFCSPDTQPVIDSTSTVELIRQKAMSADGARVIPIAALTTGLGGEFLSEMATLYKAGCLTVGQADAPIADTGVLLSAMEYASSFDIPMVITPLDPAIARNGCAHAGAIATRLGLPELTVASETVALARLIELCRTTDCRLHLSRLSSARAIDLVRQAKNDGLRVTADVGIHHLYFTHEQIDGFDVNFHSTVPFRGLEDRTALRNAVRDGSIDAICSDHAPHDKDSKLAPFPSSSAGLSAFDVFLPLLFGLPDLLNMSLIDVIAKVTTSPARIVARSDNSILTSTGYAVFDDSDYSLTKGSVADLVLIDPDAIAENAEGEFMSKGTNSPLLNLKSLVDCTDENIPLKGRVTHNFIRGQQKSLS